MVDATKTFNKVINKNEYPNLNLYTHPVKKASRKIVGRDEEMRRILAAFMRPELSNVLLLAAAGGGKTALVQGLMDKDPDRIYLEVQLSKMIANAGDNPDRIAEWLREMFNEASKFGRISSSEIVLFIDEFHQIAQLSPAAVEVMKPLLADSGTRGIRVIAATTFDEFQEYLSSNLPLVERFQRIQLAQPDESVMMDILKNFAKKYNAGDLFKDDSILHLIYELTNRYIPSQIQPRKSILVMDAMIGYHRKWHLPINKDLLAQVLYDQQGIRISTSGNATKIEDELNKHVLQQEIATTAIAQRLQICIADLNDKTKPMATFLFTGSTGVGKTEMAKQIARIVFNDTQLLIRFDMTEYSRSETMERFREEVTSKVWAHPYCILLLDEIEKADKDVTRLLLQILDDGRLSDRNNRTVSFINCYIIMTTNAGHEIYKKIGQYAEEMSPKKFLNTYGEEIKSSIQETTGQDKFPPELLGRIDAIVPFKPLAEKTLNMITLNHLTKLSKEIKLKHKITCRIANTVTEYLVQNETNLATSDAGGARSIMHNLDTDVVAPIATYINRYPNRKDICVVVTGKMRSRNNNQRTNQSYITVYSTPFYKAHRKEIQKQFKKDNPNKPHVIA